VPGGKCGGCVFGRTFTGLEIGWRGRGDGDGREDGNLIGWEGIHLSKGSELQSKRRGDSGRRLLEIAHEF